MTQAVTDVGTAGGWTTSFNTTSEGYTGFWTTAAEAAGADNGAPATEVVTFSAEMGGVTNSRVTTTVYMSVPLA